MTAPDLSDLTIGYSSLVDRLAAIPTADALGGAEQVVVAQTGSEDDAPVSEDAAREIARLQEGGATVVVLRSRGVAKSRNEAIRRATRRYLLFCDDDVTVDLEGVAAALGHLRSSGASLALGRAVDESGTLRKSYPDDVARLTLRNSGKAATYEMIADVEQTRAAGVWFDERFGAGAALYLGDEYIFIADLLRAGLRADAVPATVAMHPTESSGSRWGTGADIDARSAALSRAVGGWVWLLKPAFALRHLRTIGVGGAVRFLRPARY
ncbi:glycosyltransferase [Demequina sp. NBRC 110053]|uniref:glycosyltransferase n=1 Tax=Demequina sp. NBRC 110053 TaxID=1570342 RepID=UPI000A05CE94|nr:glycosyltransferase [Demequina sp. NBRC 110053]